MSQESLVPTALFWFGVSIFVGGSVIRNLKKKTSKNATTGSLVSSSEIEYFPPLPTPVVDVLALSRLCFLATQCDGEPHLSLMNFTYYQAEEMIILSTRRNTKKFNQIASNPKVAVLVHDFPHLDTDESIVPTSHPKKWSVTLNGKAEICEEGPSAENYRRLHLENNPDYKQFISGDDIAVIVVRIDRARMCDVQDRVSYWTAKEGIVNEDR